MAPSDSSDSEDAASSLAATLVRQREERQAAAAAADEEKKQATAKRAAEKAARTAAAQARKEGDKDGKKAKKQKVCSPASPAVTNSSDEEGESDEDEDDFSNDGDGEEDEDDSSSQENESSEVPDSSEGSDSENESNDDPNSDSDTSTETGKTVKEMVALGDKCKKAVDGAQDWTQKTIYAGLKTHLEDVDNGFLSSAEVEFLTSKLGMFAKDGESSADPSQLDANLNTALQKLRNAAPSSLINESMTTIIEHIGLLSCAVRVLMNVQIGTQTMASEEGSRQVPNGTIKRLQSSILTLIDFSEKVMPQVQEAANNLNALHTDANRALGNIESGWASILSKNAKPK